MAGHPTKIIHFSILYVKKLKLESWQIIYLAMNVSEYLKNSYNSIIKK
jgi:hypothetical protein